MQTKHMTTLLLRGKKYRRRKTKGENTRRVKTKKKEKVEE